MKIFVSVLTLLSLLAGCEPCKDGNCPIHRHKIAMVNAMFLLLAVFSLCGCNFDGLNTGGNSDPTGSAIPAISAAARRDQATIPNDAVNATDLPDVGPVSAYNTPSIERLSEQVAQNTRDIQLLADRLTELGGGKPDDRPKSKDELLKWGKWRTKVLVFTQENCEPCKRQHAELSTLENRDRRDADGKLSRWNISWENELDPSAEFVVVSYASWPEAFDWFGVTNTPTSVRITDNVQADKQSRVLTADNLIRFYGGASIRSTIGSAAGETTPLPHDRIPANPQPLRVGSDAGTTPLRNPGQSQQPAGLAR